MLKEAEEIARAKQEYEAALEERKKK